MQNFAALKADGNILEGDAAARLGPFSQLWDGAGQQRCRPDACDVGQAARGNWRRKVARHGVDYRCKRLLESPHKTAA